LKNKVESTLQDRENEVKPLGKEIPANREVQQTALIHMFQDFAMSFASLLDGTEYDSRTSKLQGGALIREIFSEAFRK
jgi:hypothetical protein